MKNNTEAVAPEATEQVTPTPEEQFEQDLEQVTVDAQNDVMSELAQATENLVTQADMLEALGDSITKAQTAKLAVPFMAAGIRFSKAVREAKKYNLI